MDIHKYAYTKIFMHKFAYAKLCILKKLVDTSSSFIKLTFIYRFLFSLPGLVLFFMVTSSSNASIK